MSDLALLGGPSVIDRPLRPYRAIGEEERRSVERVLRSGELSGFVGAWESGFFGGPTIQELERAWCEMFGCKWAVSVNSNTTGLMAAIGAIGIGPGDEVIVPPLTMSATAMAPLVYGGIPVFVDVESETFCIDPENVQAAITSRTKAIVAVNLFGHPAQLRRLRGLADRHGLALIEDNAQAPLASEFEQYTGTIGHIGVFSLNFHKHFQCGEGGVCTTDDADLARRLMMIRNHGENVVEAMGETDLTNLVGFNFRMTELSAAVALAQLRKANELVNGREAVATRLTRGLAGLPGIAAPRARSGCRHVYYVWTVRYDAELVGVDRGLFARALAAEGFPTSEGYVKPLYLLPIFQQRVAIGRDGYPFNLTARSYASGLCPVAEHLHERELLEFFVCSYEVTPEENDLLIAAFMKVYEQREELRDAPERLGF